MSAAVTELLEISAPKQRDRYFSRKLEDTVVGLILAAMILVPLNLDCNWKTAMKYLTTALPKLFGY